VPEYVLNFEDWNSVVKKYFAMVALLMPTVCVADVSDLYTQTGTDRTWQQLLDDDAIPLGENSSGGVTGSTIDVNNTLVEIGPNADNPIISSDGLRIHTLGNPSIASGRFDRWSRWYQQDGNTQVFRLFEGETNANSTRPNAARIEAFERDIQWAYGDGWQKWQGTYTIIKPEGAAIFQARNSSNDWSVQIGMSDDGDVILNRRRGEDLVLGTDMVGQAFHIEVYDNGLDYRVYYNGAVAGDGRWDRPEGTTRFRWGMYKGNDEVGSDAMLFVTGATITQNAVPEPGSLALFGAGVLLIAAAHRRRRASSERQCF